MVDAAAYASQFRSALRDFLSDVTATTFKTQNPPSISGAAGFEEQVKEGNSVFRRPGSDLLFRVLRRSTIGAGVIYGRVRDGTSCGRPDG